MDRIVPFGTLVHGLSTLDVFILVTILTIVFFQGVYVSFSGSIISFFQHGNPKNSLKKQKENLTSPTTSSLSSMESNYPKNHQAKTEKTISPSGSFSPFPSSTSTTMDNYFLADKQMHFLFVGASLFASNIGSEHFVGQAGDGARRGLVTSLFDWNAIFLLLCLGWIFTPIYRRAQIYTTPEFLEKRFNTPCRHLLTFITCLMYILTKLSASIYGGSVIFSVALGWTNLYLSAGFCIILCCLFSITGGLKAVMYMDFFQMIVFVFGGLVVFGIALSQVNGFQGLQELLKQHHDTQHHYILFQSIHDVDFPWTGMVFGQPIMATWYWCMDQDLVQRVLSAKDNYHAKSGCVLAGFLKLLPPFMTVIPGMIAAALYDFQKANVSTDMAYPILLINSMPQGVIGLIVAAILVAMISSLDSVFNAGSSIVTNDIYKHIYPNASNKELIWVGRIATIGFGVLSFCWIPMIQNGGGMFRRLMEIQSHLVPPFGIILWIGVCWKKANGKGAFGGLIIGQIIGMIRLVFIFYLGHDSTTWNNTIHLPDWFIWFLKLSFQHVAILLWLITACTCIVVSLLTNKDNRKNNIDQFLIHWDEVFALPTEPSSYYYNVVLLVFVSILIACITSLYIFFSFP